MTLRVYNTLTRKKEEFKPLHPGRVGMYVCGPTVYKPSHIGHMVGPVIFDTVKRYLTYLGYKVEWVVNITDVDDKLIVRARELGTTVKELAEKMTADYIDALKRLNVTGIDRMPKATEHIPGMIEIMRGLITNGHAYAAGGDVYFDVTHDPDYGKLCNRDPEQLEAGARIEVSDKKRNPGDFALWKGAKPGEPAWESPWGPGRPGWHIECSAMSMKYLGTTLDIHGGGLDLQFPHHENELAQSESYTGEPFARYWMHNGLLKMGHAKMAGSVGNVVNVADLLRKYQPETVRFLLLGTHYRSPIEYSDERLAETRRALEGFYRFFERFERITGDSFYRLPAPATNTPFDPAGAHRTFLAEVRQLRQAFLEHMDDDFNTGGAIGVLYELLRALNRFVNFHNLEGAVKSSDAVADFRQGAVVLRELSHILGLFEVQHANPHVSPAHVSSSIPEVQHANPHVPPAHGSASAPSALPSGGLSAGEELRVGLQQLFKDLGIANPRVLKNEEMIELLKDQRTEARKAKNFGLADQIRKGLAKLKVILEDRPGGTEWRLG